MELLLDGLLLTLCGTSLLGREQRKIQYPLLCMVLCVVSRIGIGARREALDYLFFPTDNFIFVLFLFVAMLLLNSFCTQAGEGHILWGTAAQFALYLFLCGLCLAGLTAIGLGRGFWPIYGSRLLSLLLWLALWGTGFLCWLREQLADGGMTVRVIVCNTLVVMLLLWAAYFARTFDVRLWLSMTGILLALLVLVDGLALLWEQRCLQNQQRGRLLEQYLPMVEELVESVRARQHKFNNRIMAVSAAINTADTLEEAKHAVAELVEPVRLDAADQELLKCDSKVISGVLLGKIKQAELRHIHVEAAITGVFLHRTMPEAGWVELIGILLDYAIEASTPDDIIFLRAENENSVLRLTISNPCRPLSSTEQVNLFKRGWSTKSSSGRGYGLFNVRKLVEQHHGKIIIRNEYLHGQNYLTIGALIP